MRSVRRRGSRSTADSRVTSDPRQVSTSMDVRHAFAVVAAVSWLGCSGSTEFTDAGAGDDAPADGSLGPDGGVGTVTVVVLGRFFARGEPQAGVPVLFQDAHGALITRAVTDADGEASAEVAGGGMVTVVEPGDPWITTIVGVEADDHLVVGHQRDLGVSSGAASVTVPGGGATYRVSGPCASGQGASTTVNVPLFDGCGATQPLLALRNPAALDGVLFVPSQALADGASATIAGPWQPPGTFTVALTGFDGATFASLITEVIADGRSAGRISETLPAATGGAIDATMAYPAVGDATLVTLIVNGTTPGYHYYLDHDGGPRSSLALDAAAMLPMPTIDSQFGELEWDPGNGDFDGTTLRIDGEGEKGNSLGTWDVVLPPSADSFVPPTLPADLASTWEPVYMRPSVSIVESTGLADYAAFRAVASPSIITSFVPFVLDGPLQVRISTVSR